MLLYGTKTYFQKNMYCFYSGHFKKSGHKATFVINSLEVSQNNTPKTITVSFITLSIAVIKKSKPIFDQTGLQTAETRMMKDVKTCVK